MDRKSIIAFALIGLVLLLWPLYQKKVVGVPEPVKRETIKTQQEQEPVKKAEPTVSDQTVAKIPTSPKRPVRFDTVETDLYRGVLSSAGGGTIVSWQLKSYQKNPKDKAWVDLIPESAKGNLALTAVRGNPPWETESFDVVQDSQWTDAGKRNRMIRYQFRSESGNIEKEYRFQEGRNDFELAVSGRLENSEEDFAIQWPTGLAPSEADLKDDASYVQGMALQGDELLKTKSSPTGLREGTTSWIAIRTKYFMTAVLPKIKGNSAELAVQKLNSSNGGAVWKQASFRLGMETLSSGETYRFTVYMGPLDYKTLKAYGIGLEKMMDYGMVIIRPFSIACAYTMDFLHGIVQDWGWTIIIFSILVKVLLYPLTYKSMKSMKEMQALQPKITALREKLKNDPQRLNAETMKIYKEHGVNPLGGCLPVLLQMPVLFALFAVFRSTIMFRQAGFLGLIHDLSGPDRIIPFGTSGINVLPILMGGSTFIQQKMTVQDPKQKAMMYFMPIFLTFIFYNMSAGLNLYYFMFNVLSIAQDLWMRRNKT
jgi:YidC/Oxa1 family membrane protein insertase